MQNITRRLISAILSSAFILSLVVTPAYSADTQRSLTALQALLADNTTGDISPQDLRDFLVSSQGGYGAIYVAGGTTAQTGISATPQKMTGFASNGISSGITPDHTTDTVTILVDGDYLINAAISFSGSASDTFDFEIYNDTTGTSYEASRALGVGGDVGSTPLNSLITCSATDAISIYVSSATGGTSITPSAASLIVTRVK